jgi:hypothetical protein
VFWSGWLCFKHSQPRGRILARYGDAGRGPERLPDWVLGGARRRLVLERLRAERGWSAKALAAEIECSETWVFEIYRVLRHAGALQAGEEGGYRLARGTALADALILLVDVLQPLRDVEVSRPPSRCEQD